ncbi:hypothetical protein CPB86DRAFT_784651 [Serendipita vermifera]|nr:hypothetical protein CPB86DRAFT_784651 [Serendipita vermifera]
MSVSLRDDSYDNVVEDNTTGGLSDPTCSQFRHRRKVLDIANKLHSYGLQHSLDLPQIAVVGSQSVGKSSLIESMSTITLPRSSGTCTRCPIECRLSKRPNEDWSCEVYLRRLTSGLGEERFGPTITAKSDVQERIRRAQLAILNPSIASAEFLKDLCPTPASNEVSFSKDLVSVRISGKDVDDLSFVDLPGIIAAVRSGGRDADIAEVKELVLDFIKKPSCLILLVVSCEMDLENQGAHQLARRVDPQGLRTIPVLTKPDRIAVGEHESWIKFLENKTEKFKHGWYCVKQSNQEQLNQGVTREQARENEVNFFKETPWIGLSEPIKRRLGTRFLSPALGNILFDLICQRLPELCKEVERKLQETREGLNELPEEPQGDPVTVVLNLTANFQKDVAILVQGRPEDGESGLLQKFRQHKSVFREAIFQQAPQFKPFRRSSVTEDPIEPSDTDSEQMENDGTEELEPSGKRDPSNAVYIDEVLKMAESGVTRELPGNYPYAVKKHYALRFTRPWDVPAQRLFKRMENIFKVELKKLVQQHFYRFSAGGLHYKILRIVFAQMKNRSQRTMEKLQECIALEQEEPMTSNEHYLEDYKAKYMARYKTVLRTHTRHDGELQKFMEGEFQGSEMMRTTLQNLQAMGLPANEDALLRLLPPSPIDNAIQIMAECRAYYQVAFKRFVDYVPMIIDYELFKGFERTINNAFVKGLELGESQLRERCAAYLEQDPEIVERRETLKRDYTRFESALEDLQNIPGFALSSDKSDGAESDDPFDLELETDDDI